MFGGALKDTLISDKSLATQNPSSMVVRRDVVQFKNDRQEAALALPNPPRGGQNASAENSPLAEGDKKETIGYSNGQSSYIPSASITTSVGGSKNITFDLHLLEDFKHLFDDINLGNIENNTNLVVLKIAAPVVAALALEPLISLVDTYYVGQYLGE